MKTELFLLDKKILDSIDKTVNFIKNKEFWLEYEKNIERYYAVD
jgi:hypothetical protein